MGKAKGLDRGVIYLLAACLQMKSLVSGAVVTGSSMDENGRYGEFPTLSPEFPSAIYGRDVVAFRRRRSWTLGNPGKAVYVVIVFIALFLLVRVIVLKLVDIHVAM